MKQDLAVDEKVSKPLSHAVGATGRLRDMGTPSCFWVLRLSALARMRMRKLPRKVSSWS